MTEIKEYRLCELLNKPITIMQILEEKPSKYDEKRTVMKILLRVDEKPAIFHTSGQFLNKTIKQLNKDNRLPYNAIIKEIPLKDKPTHKYIKIIPTPKNINKK